MQLELEIYRARNGKEPFRTWYATLAADRRAFDAVTQRLDRLRAGNFGDCRRVGRQGSGPGVLELRIHMGPGYRIYCARVAMAAVLLLGGGTKRSQHKDIVKAQRRLADFRVRHRGKNT